VLSVPEPKNVSVLRDSLNLENYYGRFLENLATHSAPLYSLLKDTFKFIWNEKCKRAFQKSKELVTPDQVLIHYDEQKLVTLATDVSPYGLGAVLSHSVPDCSKKPIAFASRSLINYAQIDKEALGLVWGVKKFVWVKNHLGDRSPASCVYLPSRERISGDHGSKTTDVCIVFIHFPRIYLKNCSSDYKQQVNNILFSERYSIQEYKDAKQHRCSFTTSRSK
jgi:hypothetical protein